MAATTAPRAEPDRVLRFDSVERALHWVNAALFLVLLFTASILYVGPLSAAFGRRELIRHIHVWCGIALPVPLLLALAGGWGKGLRADVRRLNRWEADGRHRGSDIVEGDRHREVEALGHVAAQRPQLVELLWALHTLGDHRQAQAVGQMDDGIHDGQVAAVAVDALDEGTVDLQPVDMEPLQVAQRRVAGAEVVDGEPDPQLAQLVQRLDGTLGILHHRPLGDLEAHRGGRD